MVQINFDATNIDPSSSFDVIPEGEYIVRAESCEMKTSKAGCKYLQFKLVICQGQYENRIVFHSINKWSNNEVARQIADKELSAICHAVGVKKPRDTAELLGVPMLAKIFIQRDKDGKYGDQNKVRWIKPRNAVSNTAQSVQAVPESPDVEAANPQNGGCPW